MSVSRDAAEQEARDVIEQALADEFGNPIDRLKLEQYEYHRLVKAGVVAIKAALQSRDDERDAANKRAEQAERVRDEANGRLSAAWSQYLSDGNYRAYQHRTSELERELTDTRAERERLRDERRRLWEDTRQVERSREQAEAQVRALREALDTLLGCFLINPRTGELGLDATKAIASRVAEARAVLALGEGREH